MEQTIFYQLSIVLALAAGVSVVFRLLRQPLIIGYMVAGFLAGPAAFGIIQHQDAFESFSQIGVTLLLFIIGLGLNVAIIRSTGKPAFITFLAIMLGVGGLGYGVASLLGFNQQERLIAATALLFSSTIIVVKALSDKKEQSRLYGQIAIGILLVEDLVATIALLFVSANTGQSTNLADVGNLLVKGIGLTAGLVIAGAYVMPRLAKFFAGSQELLYVFALAWALGVANIFWRAGFSLEVGALFAGVTFAHLPYAQEMSTRLKPLRDFFIVLFFVGLGEVLSLNNISSAIVPALIFSAIIMVSKPLITLTCLGLLGYTRQTGFKAAVHLSQISEFSVVLIVLAEHTGVVSQQLVVVMTLTTIITIALSTYLMKYDDQLYHLLRGPLGVFERSDIKREINALKTYPLVLCGYREGGYEFVRTFREMKKHYVVIDYNPAVVEVLENQHVNHIYGDATDDELLEEIGVHKSELIISTITDQNANLLLLNNIVRRNQDAIFICHAASYDEAEKLYQQGAAYVILPHFIGTERINAFIRRNGSNKKAFARYRQRQLLALGTIAAKS